MTKYLIDHDPLTGCHTEFAYDAGTDEYIINDVQDVQRIIDVNRDEFNDSHTRRFHGQDLRHVARIPNIILLDLHKKGILKDPKAFNRWLNDSANRYFRTSNETV